MTASAPSRGSSSRRIGGLALIGVGAVAALIGIATLLLPGGGGGGGTAAPTSSTSALPAQPAPGAPGTPGASGVPGAPGTGPSGAPTVPPFGGGPSGAAPAPPGAPIPPGATGIPPGQPGQGEQGQAGAPGVPGAPGAGVAAGAGGAASAGGAGAFGPGGTGGGGVGMGGGGGAAVVRVPVRVYNNSTIPGLAAEAAEQFRRAGWTIEQVGNYPFGIIPTSTVYFRPGTLEEPAAAALGSEFGLRVLPRFAGLADASPGLIVIVTNDFQRR